MGVKMNKEELINLKQKLSKLSEKEEEQRNLYLKKLASGEIQGPLTGYSSIDKPWLKYYTTEQIKTTMPNKSVYGYLYEQNKDYLGRIALNYYGRKITFDELFTKIDETAKALLSMGVKENDVDKALAQEVQAALVHTNNSDGREVVFPIAARALLDVAQIET